jgi:hypothetical protein
VEADCFDDEGCGEDDCNDKSTDDVSNAVEVVPEPAATAAAAAAAHRDVVIDGGAATETKVQP